MISVILIVFREVIEAGLIISVILAACKGYRVRSLVMAGVTFGVVFSILLATLTNTLENALSGLGQEIFNAGLLAVASMMLCWQIIWMSQKGKAMIDASSSEVSDILKSNGSNFAIAVIVATAVMREGSEIVLFLYGIVISSGTTGISLVIGGIIGLLLGVVVSYLLYRGLTLIPLKSIFAVSNVVLTFIAAGLASQSALMLANIDMLPLLTDQMWDTSAFVSNNSSVGTVLRAVFGYDATPSGIQVLVWVIVATAIFGISQAIKRNSKKMS